jgi:flagellar biosynthesis protein FliR
MVLLIHLRAIIVANMHHFVINSLDDSILNLNLEKFIRVNIVYTVINHGDFRRSGKTCWKPPIETTK